MYLYTGTYESMPCPVSGGTLGLHTPQTYTITGSTLALLIPQITIR